MDTLEQAATAFDAIDSGKAPSAPEARRSPSLDMSDLFGDMGSLEVDETSPARGGGDNLPVDGEKPAKARKPYPEDEEDDDAEVIDGGEDEDGEEPDEDADDEDDAEDDDPALAVKYEVVVDGEPVEVELKEALNGYIRTETFHRRLNELNEYKGTLAANASQLYEDRKKAIEMIDDLQKLTNQLIPKEPDWDEEYKRDPAAARRLQKQYDEIKKVKDGLEAERGNIRKVQTEEEEAGFVEYRKGENLKLLRAYPHWQDPKTGVEAMKKDLTMMHTSLSNVGFTDDEIKTIYDARMIKIAMKAARYDRLMAKDVKPVLAKNNKPSNSGVGRKSTAPKGNRGARAALQKTGSVEAAASVFTDLITPKSRRK